MGKMFCMPPVLVPVVFSVGAARRCCQKVITCFTAGWRARPPMSTAIEKRNAVEKDAVEKDALRRTPLRKTLQKDTVESF